MPSTDQLELLFDVQDSDASADASPLSASPAPPKAPVATPPAPLFPPPASSASKSAGEPLLTLSPNAAARVPTPCPDPLPPGARWREVDTDPQPIGFVLLRSRRRSIGFVITDDGLRVTAPNWVTLAQIDDAVREKSRWIVAKLREWHTRKQQLAMAHTRWQAGGELPYLGKRIVLGVGGDSRQTRLSGDADAPADGDTLWLALPADADQGRIRDAAQAWLQQRAGAWFGARLAHFLQISGLKIRRWRLSSAATRWGSCTSDGNIMLNWRLIHFAPAIIDYVIAHELAHLREMNHSQDFWREVGQILPDFEEAKNVLRRHDPASLPQF
ncbi:M48 family metallopeptidase [Achromobacter dolens]|uniref:M48 family metallopeptidase n=1 Tax=Achromobacter dolens TaxID=1287738 RepID=UPI003B99DC01